MEARPDKRPLLNDLRDAGALGGRRQRRAVPYRDEVYHRDSKAAGTAEVIVAKQRNGPTDTAVLTFLGQYTKFENYVAEEADWV